MVRKAQRKIKQREAWRMGGEERHIFIVDREDFTEKVR